MNKEILYEILNSESESLSSAEIEAILNEELDKSEEEMDTDLIDLCLDALDTVDEEKLNKRKYRIRISKALIAAVILVMLIGISIPVCARFFSIDVPDGIVSFYNDCFNVDIANDGYVNDILGQLEHDGLDDIVLPKMIFSSETKNSNYSKEESDNSTMINFDFESNGLTGHIIIRSYKPNYDFLVEENKTNLEFESIKYFSIGDISCIVFNRGKNSYINYVINNTEYNISLDCNFETACQIAKTL
ncbi:MAG: hypothetical protein ACI4XC_05675 [Eubacterium sp.]